ncbi:MAG TPA: hypothetical protein VNQ77_00855 [Frankiaceae bacterium]|nr:hypothetical protein [Frankiaceae bacterium]
MRPYLLAAAVALTAATASPATAAGTCAAEADIPTTAGAHAFGSGRFVCTLPSSGMTVTVCLESLHPAGAVGWHTETCATGTRSIATVVSADTAACIQDGLALVRTVAFGSNAEGAYAYAASAPTVAPGVGSCGP